jgi:hypothetical protein
MMQIKKRDGKAFNKRRNGILKTESINIFREINFQDIFSNEEIHKIAEEPAFSDLKVIDENEDQDFNDSNESFESDVKESEENKNNIDKNIMFDRMGLILKLLNTSIDKLNKHNEKTIAKGLEW